MHCGPGWFWYLFLVDRMTTLDMRLLPQIVGSSVAAVMADLCVMLTQHTQCNDRESWYWAGGDAETDTAAAAAADEQEEPPLLREFKRKHRTVR
jgi:hypothetical protein